MGFSFRLLKKRDHSTKVGNFIKMFPFFLLLGAFSAAQAFEITSSSPEIITVKKGGDMDLWCKTDSYWEWCKISRLGYENERGLYNSDAFVACEHAWNSNDYNVKVLNCTAFEKRYEYIGDKGSAVYKCGVRIKDLRPEDFGEWTCDVWNYYDGTNKWRSYAPMAEKTFQVEEEKNATTIIREIREEIQTTKAQITKLLNESEEKIKIKLNAIAP